MKETENGRTMYEVGREFYERRIEDLTQKAETVTSPYDALEVQDELELAQLKLSQLNRREQVLERKNETQQA